MYADCTQNRRLRARGSGAVARGSVSGIRPKEFEHLEFEPTAILRNDDRANCRDLRRSRIPTIDPAPGTRVHRSRARPSGHHPTRRSGYGGADLDGPDIDPASGCRVSCYDASSVSRANAPARAALGAAPHG